MSQEKIEQLESSKGFFKTSFFASLLLLILAIIFIVFAEFIVKENGKYKFSTDWNKGLNAKLQSELAVKTSQVESYKQQLEGEGIIINNSTKGIWFEVQLGAFKNFDLKQYKGNLTAISEENGDDFTKYTVGKFMDYQVATNFKKDIQKMGIKNAWVVAKKDGKRIEVKRALTELKK